MEAEKRERRNNREHTTVCHEWSNMTIDQPLQPPTYTPSINSVIVIITDDSDHHTRSRRIHRERKRWRERGREGGRERDREIFHLNNICEWKTFMYDICVNVGIAFCKWCRGRWGINTPGV